MTKHSTPLQTWLVNVPGLAAFTEAWKDPRNEYSHERKAQNKQAKLTGNWAWPTWESCPAEGPSGTLVAG